MKWFLNLKTGSKLLLAFGLMIILQLIVVVTAYLGINMIQTDFRSALTMVDFESNNHAQRTATYEAITMSDPTAKQAAQQRVMEASDSNSILLQKLYSDLPDLPDISAKLDELTKVRDEYRKDRNEKVLPLALAGRTSEALTLSESQNTQRFDRMREISKELGDHAQAQAAKVTQTIKAGFIIISMISVIIGLLLAVFISRTISIPLADISAVADHVAAGDLTVETVAMDRGDEIGLLSQTFSKMTTSLQGMAGVASQIAAGDLSVKVQPQSPRDVLANAFSTMIENLQRLTSQITEGINVLSSSTNEISASTTQFAANATETAAAVSETTTTVEEVRQTAQVSSEKARFVSDAAQKVSLVSQSGRKATEDAMEGMNRIRQEMDAIAESMVRLSDQSQAIGQIVTTVEDIAIQANLLAVNASIEAAKAGEFGKGFAVVAQEVKSLAQQSKLSTDQVRIILTDIQKATAAAVMATEQGSRAVENGVKQSAIAGQSIHALATSVGESANAAVQIATSSQQQLIGVGQVASAMENIKQASLQNVDSAKQLESAAFNLKELGHKLKTLVERYKV